MSAVLPSPRPAPRVRDSGVQTPALAKHLAGVRKQGYALDLGETVAGHHCPGAPVFDADSPPLAPIWLTAPSPRLSKADGKQLAPNVIEAAQRISEALR